MNLIRLFFSAALLALFAQPAWAETVYYCTTDKIAVVTEDKVYQLGFDRFKMAVGKEQVRLSGGSRFTFKEKRTLSILNISPSRGYDLWHGEDSAVIDDETTITTALASFDNGILSYVQLNIVGGTSLTAKCETF